MPLNSYRFSYPPAATHGRPSSVAMLESPSHAAAAAPAAQQTPQRSRSDVYQAVRSFFCPSIWSKERKEYKNSATDWMKGNISCRREVLEQVEKELINAHKFSRSELILRARGLKDLPEGFGNLPMLRSLNLESNQLTAMPASIGNAVRLENLNARDNQLGKMPETIGQLSRLRHLDLSHNQLEELPASIGQLSQLRHLDLSHNQLEGLPEIFGQMSRLDLVDLTGNELQSLPKSLFEIQPGTQRKIIVNGNRLTSLPEYDKNRITIQPECSYHQQLRLHEKAFTNNVLDSLVVPDNSRIRQESDMLTARSTSSDLQRKNSISSEESLINDDTPRTKNEFHHGFHKMGSSQRQSTQQLSDDDDEIQTMREYTRVDAIILTAVAR